MVKLTCLNCAADFYVKPYKEGTAKFCSRKCYTEYGNTQKSCENCGTLFLAKRAAKDRTKFCSKKCREEYHFKRGKMLECKLCGTGFYAPHNTLKTSKFCSNLCRKEYKDSTQTLVCCICGKTFYRKTWQLSRAYKSDNFYCSSKCYYKKAPKEQIKCAGCGKDFYIYPSRKKYNINCYCSNKCRIKFGGIGRLTDSINFSKNYSIFAAKLRNCIAYKNWRMSILKRDKYKCLKCNSLDRSKLTVHHRDKTIYDFIKEYGFDKAAIWEDTEFFSLNNGETLCRKCHFESHVSIQKEGNNG